MLHVRSHPQAVPGTAAFGDRGSPDPDGMTVGCHSYKGSGFTAAGSFEVCWAQPLKIFVLFRLQILGSGALYVARSNVFSFPAITSCVGHLMCLGRKTSHCKSSKPSSDSSCAFMSSAAFCGLSGTSWSPHCCWSL